MISEVTCVKNGWLICASEIDQEEYCVRISDIDSIHYSLIDGRSRSKANNGTEFIVMAMLLIWCQIKVGAIDEYYRY